MPYIFAAGSPLNTKSPPCSVWGLTCPAPRWQASSWSASPPTCPCPARWPAGAAAGRAPTSRHLDTELERSRSIQTDHLAPRRWEGPRPPACHAPSPRPRPARGPGKQGRTGRRRVGAGAAAAAHKLAFNIEDSGWWGYNIITSRAVTYRIRFQFSHYSEKTPISIVS